MRKNFELAIFMATFEDDHFIIDQLDSIMMQTYLNFKLYVSDDSVSKKTYKIITQYQKEYPDKIIYQQGPKENYVNNFLELVNQKIIQADIFLFCDQDDFWVPKKLEYVANCFQQNTNKKPALYASSKIIIDNKKKFIGHYNIEKFTPSLQNSFFENITGGNTMAFNSKFRDILMQYDIKGVQIPSHDWWCYIVAMIHDAEVILDRRPLVFYRQHQDALVGFRENLFTRIFKTLTKIASKNFFLHQQSICEILSLNQQYWRDLAAAKEVYNFLIFMQSSRFKKLKLFLKNNYKRQSQSETLLLFFLILFVG
jgi:glycosyltransferase involved in cell wall biosynthesis